MVFRYFLKVVQTRLEEMTHRVRRNRLSNQHHKSIVRAFEDLTRLPFAGRYVRGRRRNMNTVTLRNAANGLVTCKLTHRDV